MSSTQPAQPAAAAAAAAAAPPAATQPPKPREEPEGMHEEAALLEAFAQIPSIGRGWCFPQPGGAARVALQVAQRNLAANAQRKYLLQFPLSEATLEQGGEVEAGMPTELKDVAMLAPSPSGKLTLIVRSGTGETSAVLEVWGRGRLLKELHVPKALHGSIYNDGWFGAGAAWSPDETRLAYVAEAPAASKTPEWGARPGAAGKKWEGAGPKGWRGVGEWSEDWGELNTGGVGRGEWSEDWGELSTGKRHPALFVLDLATWEVAAVGGLPEDSSCGQPVWAPEGESWVTNASSCGQPVWAPEGESWVTNVWIGGLWRPARGLLLRPAGVGAGGPPPAASRCGRRRASSCGQPVWAPEGESWVTNVWIGGLWRPARGLLLRPAGVGAGG
ncbi:hypothetical protein N2152v2_010065 [Parachlorella kessleri]